MPFSNLDGAALGRSLAQIADREGDIADLFLERRELVEVGGEDDEPGLKARREEGFALRLLRDGRTWLAARDGLRPEDFGQAVREVARAQPRTPYRPPRALGADEAALGAPIEASEVTAFPAAVARRIRAAHVAFPLRLVVRRFRRWVQVVGRRLIGDPMTETFYSVSAEFAWGRYGSLLLALGEEDAEKVARALIDHFHARDAHRGAAGDGALVLGPAATAVLLHEAVAHTLEADTLILSGRPEAACGYRLGSEQLSVLDDPAGAPEAVARRFDDEGVPVMRRWLLRAGEIHEPLADRFFSASSERLTPGAARRADRHAAPAPRSTHLELLAGDAERSELWQAARGGFYLPEVSRGRLDPIRGEFSLRFPYARRITGDGPADFLGPCGLRGRIHQLLTSVESVGSQARFEGAGWCAKGGQLMPVWATCPAVLVSGLELVP